VADQRGGGIAWTEQTWNPVRGCSKVSEGCRHCYAMHVAARFSGEGEPYQGLATRDPARWTGKVELVEKHLTDPLRWRRPRRVFVNSMSDLFHEALPDEAIDGVFAVMALAPRHTFQVLTKRPSRMRDYMADLPARKLAWARAAALLLHGETDLAAAPRWADNEPLPNVWLGTSVEDQRAADERIPLLLETPAAVRFLSVEPLLGPVRFPLPCTGSVFWGGLHWVIVGGESGPNARPCDVAWLRDIVRQCRDAAVPVFTKQMGSNCYVDTRQNKTLPGWRRAFRDRKGSDPAEWPEDLRVREWPRG